MITYASTYVVTFRLELSFNTLAVTLVFFLFWQVVGQQAVCRVLVYLTNYAFDLTYSYGHFPFQTPCFLCFILEEALLRKLPIHALAITEKEVWIRIQMI